MRAALPIYGDVITIVPDTGIQFLDFGLRSDQVQKSSRAFWEQEDAAAEAGKIPFRLRFLEIEPNSGEYRDTETGTAPPPPFADGVERAYTVTGKKAIDALASQWLPLPLFRVAHHEDGIPVRFALGPSNWARLRVVPLPAPDDLGNTHRVIVAIDTRLIDSPNDAIYYAPSSEDARLGREFALAANEHHNRWWLHEAWLDSWIDQAFQRGRARGKRPRPGAVVERSYPYCEDLATYLTLLQVLDEVSLLPRLRLVDTVSRPARFIPVDVDLVLDVGNSRTCGILVESTPDERTSLNDSYVLALRDLTHPEEIYSEPFDTSIEFARASFGPENLSRLSGRSGAFAWPSVTRIGTEARRLSYRSHGTEGSTGMSSPKRYLWDTRMRQNEWRFSSTEQEGQSTEPPVTEGEFVNHVTEAGEPVETGGFPAFEAKFSRSSLMSFALTEILLQALVQMNSAGLRCSRRNADIPRRLRRVIMTMPTAMPLEERRLLDRRVRNAVKLTWRCMGWKDDGPPHVREPKVELQWDEATCTQLVYLYAEVRERFQGDGTALFDTLGRVRTETGSPGTVLRIASIDIGGGTTDLTIVRYFDRAGRDNVACSIEPVQEFREGFNLAGDDILRAIIERHVLRSIAAGLRTAGVADAVELLTELLGADRGGQTALERTLRQKFCRQLAYPIALALVHEAEGMELASMSGGVRKPIREFFDEATLPAANVVSFLDRAARTRGARDGTTVLDFTIDVTFAELDAAIRDTMKGVLDDLCEVVSLYDCDLLLLTGRPSRLPTIQSCIYGRFPVRPDRIQPMHQYSVGNWYPFRDVRARIVDPKTTAVVGATLCALSRGHLDRFHLASDKFKMKSTARFIGPMEENGKMLTERLLFRDVDLENPSTEIPEKVYEMFAPIFIGFRQLDVDRWTSTQLYRLECPNPEALRRVAFPIKVPVARRQARSEADEKWVLESFEVADGLVDASGESVSRNAVVLRLQTLKTQDADGGHWLDTGGFHVSRRLI